MLARAGHHAKILIADGNYPVSTKRGPNAELVCLNLSPGVVTVAQVLHALLSAVPVDHVHTMGIPPDDPYARQGEPPPPDHANASWNDDSCHPLLTVTDPPSLLPESMPSSRDQPIKVSRTTNSPEVK